MGVACTAAGCVGRQPSRASASVSTPTSTRRAGRRLLPLLLLLYTHSSLPPSPPPARFREALRLQPADYSLWNKLGATLANSSRSSEAIGAYQKVAWAGREGGREG